MLTLFIHHLNPLHLKPTPSLSSSSWSRMSPQPNSSMVRHRPRPLAARMCHRNAAEPDPFAVFEAQIPLPPPLQRKLLPKHVAIIMDGNSRWARARGKDTSAGHLAGFKQVMEIIRLSSRWGISVLTVFLFSSENWHRPKEEVDFIMFLIGELMVDITVEFADKGLRLSVIGDTHKLPVSEQQAVARVEGATKTNKGLHFVIATSYGGRGDIVKACQRVAEKVKSGTVEPGGITEDLVSRELGTSCIVDAPCPDLLIRTSGEQRLSNFLLWELAYAELYFAETLWPDFGEAEYVEALSWFQGRNRRFGRRK